MDSQYILRIDYKFWNTWSLYSFKSKEQRYQILHSILFSMHHAGIGYSYDIRNTNRLAIINIIGSKHISSTNGLQKEESFKTKYIDMIINHFGIDITVPLESLSSDMSTIAFQLQISYKSLQKVVSMGFAELSERTKITNQLGYGALTYNIAIIPDKSPSTFHITMDICGNTQDEYNFHNSYIVPMLQAYSAYWIVHLHDQ